MAGEKESLWIKPGFVIPASELHFAFARSSGPGGQNVNKTATKVRLKWWPAQSSAARAALSAVAVERLLERAEPHLTEDGSLQVVSDSFRTREANKRASCQKLAGKIRSWLRIRKKRVPTSPTKNSKVSRLDNKRRTSRLKAQRKKPDQE